MKTCWNEADRRRMTELTKLEANRPDNFTPLWFDVNDKHVISFFFKEKEITDAIFILKTKFKK